MKLCDDPKLICDVPSILEPMEGLRSLGRRACEPFEEGGLGQGRGDKRGAGSLSGRGGVCRLEAARRARSGSKPLKSSSSRRQGKRTFPRPPEGQRATSQEGGKTPVSLKPDFKPTQPPRHGTGRVLKQNANVRSWSTTLPAFGARLGRVVCWRKGVSTSLQTT